MSVLFHTHSSLLTSPRAPQAAGTRPTDRIVTQGDRWAGRQSPPWQDARWDVGALCPLPLRPRRPPGEVMVGDLSAEWASWG